LSKKQETLVTGFWGFSGGERKLETAEESL
jgi:hypothetical protein